RDRHVAGPHRLQRPRVRVQLAPPPPALAVGRHAEAGTRGAPPPHPPFCIPIFAILADVGTPIPDVPPGAAAGGPGPPPPPPRPAPRRLGRRLRGGGARRRPRGVSPSGARSGRWRIWPARRMTARVGAWTARVLWHS